MLTYRKFYTSSENTNFSVLRNGILMVVKKQKKNGLRESILTLKQSFK